MPNPYNTSNAEDEGSFRQGYHAALKRIEELMACRGHDPAGCECVCPMCDAHQNRGADCDCPSTLAIELLRREIETGLDLEPAYQPSGGWQRYFELHCSPELTVAAG